MCKTGFLLPGEILPNREIKKRNKIKIESILEGFNC
jgi:hypothetical protein